MTGIIGRCVALLLVTGGLLAATPPQSQAATGIKVAVDASVLYDRCTRYPVSLKAASTAPSVDWDLTAIGPDGTEASSLYATTATAHSSIFLCGGLNGPGKYQLVGTFDECSYSPSTYEQTCVSTPVHYSFRLSLPRTRTSLSASPQKPHFNQVVTFSLNTEQQTSNGYKGTSGVLLRLQVRVKKKWVSLRDDVHYTQGQYGYTTARFRWNLRGTYVLRAYRPASDTAKASVSRPVAITTR